jgi:Spy/CpxP family protein refolding chaperone
VRARIVVLGLAATLSAGGLEAQRARGLEPGGGERGGGPPRELLRKVRQAFMGQVRRQLNLTDEQAKRLQDVDRKFEQQRNQLRKDEGDARRALRVALEDTTTAPDPAKVEEYLNRLVKDQHRRADVLEAEQKELAAFLNPVQRAKFFALRDQLARRINELQGQGRGGRRGGPPPLD